jgi:hypothetical protein
MYCQKGIAAPALLCSTAAKPKGDCRLAISLSACQTVPYFLARRLLQRHPAGAHVLGDGKGGEVSGCLLQNTGVMLPSSQGEALALG